MGSHLNSKSARRRQQAGSGRPRGRSRGVSYIGRRRGAVSRLRGRGDWRSAARRRGQRDFDVDPGRALARLVEVPRVTGLPGAWLCVPLKCMSQRRATRKRRYAPWPLALATRPRPSGTSRASTIFTASGDSARPAPRRHASARHRPARQRRRSSSAVRSRRSTRSGATPGRGSRSLAACGGRR